MSDPQPEGTSGVDWPELAVAVFRTGLMLIVVVMADPSLRWEAMLRAERFLKWWNHRRAEVPLSPPPAPAPALTAVLERAREITKGTA